MFSSAPELAQRILKSLGKLWQAEADELMSRPVQGLVGVVLTCSCHTNVHTLSGIVIGGSEVDHINGDVCFLFQGILEGRDEGRAQPTIERQVLVLDMVYQQSHAVFDLANTFELEAPRASGACRSSAPSNGACCAKFRPALFPKRKTRARRLPRLD